MKQVFTVFFLLLGSLVFGQSVIELEGADELEGVLYKDVKANLLNGNVKVVHDGTRMTCDKAYLFGKMNNFDAFGNVKIVKPDGMTVYGDSLYYDATTKIAKLRGNVRVIDGNSVITTNYLDYDTENQTAWYYGGGNINDDGTRLSSETGFYDSKQAFYSFKGDVKVNKPGYRIEADTLKYAAGPERAYFYGPTDIYTTDKHLYAESGIYNTREEKGWFSQNAWVESETYKLSGDSLYFDNIADYGYAMKDVEIISFKEDATIYGDVAVTEGSKNKSTVFGHALLVDRSETDTTYISADTLISLEDTAAGKKDIFAYRNVSIVKGLLSGNCDSMVYRALDSTISFYEEPILWNANTQITSDSITVLLKDDAVDRMYAYVDAFLISQSTIDTSRYDQIKGREMIAYFEEGSLYQLDVDGNGESVYYAYNDDEALIGVNTFICSNMKMYLVDGNMDHIKVYDRPIAHFIPPQLLEEKDKYLLFFDWRIDEQPLSEELVEVSSERESVLLKDLEIPPHMRFQGDDQPDMEEESLLEVSVNKGEE